MEDRQGAEVPVDLNVIFGPDVDKLSSQQRKKYGLAYIDKFSYRKIDNALLKQAGITEATTNPKHLELAKLMGVDLPMAELETRMNYCQYLFQEEGDPQVLPFTELDQSSNMHPKDVNGISPSREIRVVKEPFYASVEQRMVKQYGEEEKGVMLEIDQLYNKGNRLLEDPKPIVIPSTQAVAVLYFTKPTPASSRSS